MRVPKQLTGEAKSFWQRHAARCVSEGTLTEATADTFLLLARTWGLLSAIDFADPKGSLVWNGTLKSYERYALQFGLCSKKKPTKPIDLNDILKEIDAEEDEEGEARH